MCVIMSYLLHENCNYYSPIVPVHDYALIRVGEQLKQSFWGLEWKYLPFKLDVANCSASSITVEYLASLLIFQKKKTHHIQGFMIRGLLSQRMGSNKWVSCVYDVILCFFSLFCFFMSVMWIILYNSFTLFVNLFSHQIYQLPVLQ